jgi:hypothetical protein
VPEVLPALDRVQGVREAQAHEEEGEMTKPKFCQNRGHRDVCLEEPDERYTMNFDDIGERPIYWCAYCGPESHRIAEQLKSLMEHRPGFQEEFEAAIEAAIASEAN